MKKVTNHLDKFELTGMRELSAKLRENGIKVDFSEQEQATIDKVLSIPPADVNLKEIEVTKKVSKEESLGSKNVKMILKIQD
ncbi:hypothetical protein [Vibrio anguillarum]|uniref:Uncharacterized protein n=1 Tax=Vibrio anguillarum TaxID=55601 RepID=A0AAW4BJW8_VIBAN|nr:hypothetical protein [Vibrio anguillarum]MBF4374394.1 hypothetical protein [Vibrio anguillarum]MBF4436636.1 hypothetical protein [Vibrio anguillarum]